MIPQKNKEKPLYFFSKKQYNKNIKGEALETPPKGIEYLDGFTA